MMVPLIHSVEVVDASDADVEPVASLDADAGGVAEAEAGADGGVVPFEVGAGGDAGPVPFAAPFAAASTDAADTIVLFPPKRFALFHWTNWTVSPASRGSISESSTLTTSRPRTASALSRRSRLFASL
jgi:hypothetical protein